MTVIRKGQQSFGNAGMCHVCSKPVYMGDVGVEHDGHVGIRNKDFDLEGYGHIVLHTECATVLAMRFIHDVMTHNERTEQTPKRVVETLNSIRKANNENT